MEYTFIEQTLQPGPTVSLKCSASGNPTPSMAWSLDGFKLPDHPRWVIFHRTTCRVYTSALRKVITDFTGENWTHYYHYIFTYVPIYIVTLHAHDHHYNNASRRVITIYYYSNAFVIFAIVYDAETQQYRFFRLYCAIKYYYTRISIDRRRRKGTVM